MQLSQLDINKVYTYADYFKWKFDERIELIKGRIFKMSPAPSSVHQMVSREISGALWLFLKGKNCQVFSAPFDVRLPDKSAKDEDIFTVVQPDICVVCDNKKIDSKGCIGAPDIVIEILSPSNSEKELKHKYEVYEESGVKEYWIVFPAEKTLLVHILKNGRFEPGRLQTIGDMVTSTVLSGFTLKLTEVFPPDCIV